jgi:zinc transporter
MDAINPAAIPASHTLAVPGLVWAFRFREGGEAEALSDDAVPAALESDEGWLWLHFSQTDARARDWISRYERLPEAARALFCDKDERQRIEVEGDTIYGVFSDFQLELGGGGEDFGRLRFACTENIFISARRHALRSVEETRQAVNRGVPVPAAADLIEHIVENFCEGAANVITRMNDQLDHVEDHVVAERVEEERRHLVPIRRAAVALHRQLFSLSSIFRNWGVKIPAGDLKRQTEQLVSRLEGLHHDLSATQERARLLQEEISAKLAEETNRSLKALSTMTALLLPGSLIAGLFGMNAGPVPWATAEGGFWYAAMLCVLATFVFVWLLRRAGFRFN